MISWQAEVDELVGCIAFDYAVLFSLDGVLLAKSSEFDVSEQEIQLIIEGFDDDEKMYANGITVAGEEYYVLEASDNRIRARNEENVRVVCAKGFKIGFIGISDYESYQGEHRISVGALINILESKSSLHAEN